eukprot:TRINITY_DN64614_c0_g1_i1.p1 TRINITY_DN64614_c0_g1~~TRINITY_DN64614_c0_g1_i1.p1  ORF type:complete len:129 (+),score=34.35 TRINITY_DN64614_c0_g1_i1:77-463(+)
MRLFLLAPFLAFLFAQLCATAQGNKHPRRHEILAALQDDLGVAYASQESLRKTATFRQLLGAALIYSGEVETAEEAREKASKLTRRIDDDSITYEQFTTVLAQAGADVASELLAVLKNVEVRQEKNDL